MKIRDFGNLHRILSLLLVLALAACSSGGDSGGSSSSAAGLNGALSVSGQTQLANSDPFPGATIYIPGTTVSAASSSASRRFGGSLTAPDGTVCEDPPASDLALASTCSSADGTFTLDTSGLTTNPTQIVCRRGNLVTVGALDNSGGDATYSVGNIAFDADATWPKVAVVTGDYDRMEDVLAKLADSDTTDDVNGQYGRVDKITGIFVYGSEYGSNLTIIDGTGFTFPTENSGSLTYNKWDSFLDGTNSLSEFDVVFINCGNAYEFSDLTSNVSVLQNFVNNGGRLYVTDWSYDHVEQAFPQVMQFENDTADPNTPGVLNNAERGNDGVTVTAAVNETALSNWLANISVIGKTTTTPGLPDDDCLGFGGSSGYTISNTALTSTGLIPIGDFLAGWARMVGPHTGFSPTIWVSSGAGNVFDGLDNRPLTISMDIGSEGGKVIYSSYHTAEVCPTTYYWPQERVLQYLIFGTF